MPVPNYIQIGGSGAPVTAPGGGAIGPANPSIVSVSVADTAPDSSGSPQKLVTVVYTPPTPLGTFSGIDIWLDAPDTSGALTIADGTVPADGNTPAVGVFAPAYETFLPYLPNNLQAKFVVPAPTVIQLWRVYITPASANVQVNPVEYGQPGATPSFQIAVLPPASAGSGVEFAPAVQSPALNSGPGFTPNPFIQVAASGDQTFVVGVIWTWPTNDPNFAKLGGVNIIVQNNTAGNQSYPGNVAVSAAGVYTSSPISVLPGTTSYTVYLLSYDVSGNSNTLVPGVTPSVTFTVTHSTGTAGIEYAHLVTSDGVHAFVVVTKANGADGTQLLQVDGYWKNFVEGDAGYDPRFGGAQIIVDKADGNGPIWSVVKGAISPIENDISQPATVATWTFYLVSIDINGRSNTVQSGITPNVSVSVGSATGVLNLAKAVSTSLSTQFTIVSGAVTINAISAGIVTTGVLQVGGGSGMPSLAKFFDHLGSLMAFIGDDTGGTGYVGAWFKQARIGGASFASAPIQADTSGNVTIAGATFTLTLNGVTTSILNTSAFGSFAGLQVTLNSTGQAAYVLPLEVGIVNGLGHQVVRINSASTSGPGEIQVLTSSGSADILLESGFGIDISNSYHVNGTQVVSSRVVTTPVTLADVIAVLQHHGLSN